MGLIKIHNRQNFVLGDIPAYHPASMKYLEFWREQKRRLIEGFWAPDDVGCNVDVQSFNPNVSKVVSTQWRWIPGNSYFYINFGTILHRPEGRPKTEPKIAMRPELRDVEWEIFYDIMEARGFSGFALDEEYSCNKDLIDPMLSESDYDDTCVGKEYVPARQYLRQLYTKPLGRPIFRNEAENYMLLSCRELGKSFCIGIGVILHELVTDGRKEYDLEQEVPISKQFVGSGMAGKSYDLMKKVRFAMQKLPGTWKPGTVDEVPSPFYKEMSGSIRPNNKWVHEYQKKIGGGWRTYGTRSDITHGVWTIENPEAAAGERYTFIICEECGLTSNLLTISGSNNAAQRQGTLQYGSSVYLGCVCAGTKVWKNNGELVNIEDLKLEDGIIGYDKILDKVVPQNIEILKSPETKECYRITLNSGRYLECSYDHPIYTRTRWDCGIMHKEFKYVKTVDLKVGDGIAVINNLDIFGNRRMFDPRLMGWLISDGTY
ncbi:hypothetical protein KKH23_07165, partial [Patescibacteria group bacterium]|nr:hypothetical protein [Patescibacteria group bacterium]